MKSLVLLALLVAAPALAEPTKKAAKASTPKTYYFKGGAVIAKPNASGFTAKPKRLNCVEVDCPKGFDKTTKCYQCDGKKVPPKAMSAT